MGRNVAQQLIEAHLVNGDMVEGLEVGLRVDQTLTQDATGTLVMLELEALGLDRAHTEVSVQYVDHNLLQADERNAEDHLFLRSAARRFGLWFSKPGNGVSHPTHMQRFGKPGKTMLGSDSHTCAAGSLGMLAIGVGGLEVALAIAGKPLHIRMPQIWGVRLTGELPPWCSAKDVILEMLRRHGVKGGLNRIIEYHGPGLEHLSAMDRHVIANMGAELGATTTVFPADDAVRAFLRGEGREDDFTELVADSDADYDVTDEIDLSTLEPLIARPTSPTLALPERASVNTAMLEAPLPEAEAVAEELVKGPNIASLPDFPELPARIEAPVLLKVGDDVSTDEISPAGARALPFRSNIPKLAEFTFTQIDQDYPRRAAELAQGSGHFVIGGHNYGQGSSREHAAITPRYLGMHAVIAKSFARIHWQNLANFGILALEFTTEDDYDRMGAGDALLIDGVRAALSSGGDLTVTNTSKNEQYSVRHRLSPRQVEMVLASGQIPLLARGQDPHMPWQ